MEVLEKRECESAFTKLRRAIDNPDSWNDPVSGFTACDILEWFEEHADISPAWRAANRRALDMVEEYGKE